MSPVLTQNDRLIIVTHMFLSLGTTILATALIIYRIRHFSKDIVGVSARYDYTVEVLVESGALYAVTLLADCILLVTRGTAFSATPERQGISFWVGIVTPVAVSTRHITPRRMINETDDIFSHRGLLQHL